MTNVAIYNYQTKKIDFTNLGNVIKNIAALLSLEQEEQNYINETLKNMFESELLKHQDMMQLSSFGIPAWELLSKKAKLSCPILMEMSNTGALNNRYVALLIEAIKEWVDMKAGESK